MNCEHKDIIKTEKIFSNGTKHLEQRCDACGKFMGYAPQEITTEKLANYKMPFGKYKDEYIAEVIQKDMDYLLWAKANLKGSVKKVIDLLIPDTNHESDNL